MKPVEKSGVVVSRSQGGNSISAIFVRAPSGGIPKLKMPKLGNAVCDVMDTITVDGVAEFVETEKTVKVHNFVTLFVLENGERIGVAIRIGSIWVGIAGDCNDGSEVT